MTQIYDVLFPVEIEVKEVDDILKKEVNPEPLDNYNKKEIWVNQKKEQEAEIYKNLSPVVGYDWWDYKQYLYNFYNYYIAKGKVVEPLSIADFEQQKQKFIDDEKAKIQAETQRKIDNSRVKLTNAERYLAVAAGIKQYVVMIDCGYDKRDKTPAEIRQAIKAMRKRKNYANLVKFHNELKAISETGLKGLYDLMSRFSYKLVWQVDTQLGKFVLAEDRIKNLSESEIEKLAILEAI